MARIRELEALVGELTDRNEASQVRTDKSSQQKADLTDTYKALLAKNDKLKRQNADLAGRNEALGSKHDRLLKGIESLQQENGILKQKTTFTEPDVAISSNSASRAVEGEGLRSAPKAKPEIRGQGHVVPSDAKAKSQSRDTGGSKDPRLSGEESNESDTEDAAQVLEAMAYGLPSFNQERRATLPSLRESYSDGQKGSRPSDQPVMSDHPNVQLTSKNRPVITLPRLPSLTNFSVVPAPPTMNTNAQDSQLEQCLRLLPKMKDLKNIALWYLREIDPILNCVNRVIFQQELSEFEVAFNARSTNSRISPPMSIDLSFLALLFAVLSASAEYRTSSELVEFGFAANEESMDVTLESYYCSSITLLGLSDYGERPTINGLSSIVALSHYAFARRKQQSYGALVVMSLRLAEVLGIHKLGSAWDDAERWKKESKSTNNSLDDPMIPNGLGGKPSRHRRLSSTSRDSHTSGSPGAKSLAGQGKDKEKQPLHGMFLPPSLVQMRESETQYADYNHSKRETARSVWLALCVLESFTSSHVGSSTYLASKNGITTAFPLNLEDEELPNSEAGDYSIRPHPFQVPTTKRFVPILYQVGMVARKIVDSMIAGEGYSAMSDIDSRMMEIKSKLPDFFVYDGVTEHTAEIKELHRRCPYLTFQRILLNEWIFHRLLQCHRIYMTRGYRNAKYKFSLDRSIECAQGVIQMRREMDAYMKAAPGRQARANYGLLTVHLFQAASALQMYLLHQVNAREKISDYLLKDIEDAIVYLEAHPSGQTRQAMAQNAIDVLRNLRREMRSRLSPESRFSPNKQGDSYPKINLHQPASYLNSMGASTSASQHQRDQHIAPYQSSSQHLRSHTTNSQPSSSSWDSMAENGADLTSQNEINTSQPRHVRSVTWQASPAQVQQTQDPPALHSNTRPSYPSDQQQLESRIQTSSASYFPANAIPDYFGPDSDANDSAQLPFDLDEYLKTVSATIPGERGDRVFQTLDGLLTANGAGLGAANPGSGGAGPSASGLPMSHPNKHHSSAPPVGYTGSPTQNFRSFPIPPQAPSPLPLTPHYGYGITTAPVVSSDSSNLSRSENSFQRSSPNTSNSSPMTQPTPQNYHVSGWNRPSPYPYHPAPPAHHNHGSSSPHMHQSQHWQTQGQPRGMASTLFTNSGAPSNVSHHS